MQSKEVKLPARFNELNFFTQRDFINKALKSESHLVKIIEWLKDPKRKHNQTNDDTIIIKLFPKINRLIEEGIELPPPYTSEDFSNYVRDFRSYLKIYMENPHRDATEKEKEQMCNNVMGNYSFYDIDPIIFDLAVYKLLPNLNLEPKMYSFQNILDTFQLFEKNTVKEILHLGMERGDFHLIGLDKLLHFFTEKVTYFKDDRRFLPQYNKLRERGIQNNELAVSFFKQELIQQSRNVYSEIQTAKANESYLGRLPINLANSIVEYTTGLKPNQYKGGTRRSKSLKRKTRKRN